jgi:hypothetical protein
MKEKAVVAFSRINCFEFWIREVGLRRNKLVWLSNRRPFRRRMRGRLDLGVGFRRFWRFARPACPVHRLSQLEC